MSKDLTKAEQQTLKMIGTGVSLSLAVGGVTKAMAQFQKITIQAAQAISSVGNYDAQGRKLTSWEYGLTEQQIEFVRKVAEANGISKDEVSLAIKKVIAASAVGQKDNLPPATRNLAEMYGDYSARKSQKITDAMHYEPKCADLHTTRIKEKKERDIDYEYED